MIWTDVRGSTSLLAAFALVGIAGVTAAAMEMSRVTAATTQLQDLADATALSTARLDAEGRRDKAALETDAEALALSLMRERAPDATEAQAAVDFSKERPAVTVRLSQKVGLFGTAGAEATAVVEPDAPVCLLVLDPHAPRAWAMTGSATVSAQDCAAQVNSAADRALDGGGAAKVSMLRTLVVGGAGSVRGFTPTPRLRQPVLQDPYAQALQWPQPAHCDQTDWDAPKGVSSLQPGVYCGGLSIRGGATVNLSPGVYVLKDGPLKVASHGTLNGPEGVTFVLVGDGGYVESRAGANLVLKAPSSGPWAGFVVAQPVTSGARQSSVVIGGGDVDVDGMIYLPSNRMMISGGGEGGVGALVVRTLDMRGNGRLRLAPGPNTPTLPGTPRLEDDPPPPPPPPGGPG